MSTPTYTLNLPPLQMPGKPESSANRRSPAPKFSFGYFFGQRGGHSFRDLAEEYAPFLREICFSWPGLLSARELDGDPVELRKRLVDDLLFCRSKGMRLDLLADATCYGDTAFTAIQREEYLGHLKTMTDAGVMPEIVTSVSPYIAAITKKFSESVERRASVNAKLFSTLAMEYVSLEFDSFCIGRDVQRDLPTVRTFAAWADKNGKKLSMTVNCACLRFCPWQRFHETLCAHHFAHALPEMERVSMPPTLCSGVVAEKRYEEILRASWIRPEDLRRYEPYVSVVTLSTREAPRPDLILRAYTSGTFDGDLLLLLDRDYASLVAPMMFDNKAVPPEWSEGKIAGLCAADCTHCGKCADTLKRVLKRAPAQPA